MKLIELVTGPWAMLPAQLIELQGIYATHLRGDKIDIAAIEARLGRPLQNEQQVYEVQPGGVAVLPVQGVMSPRANMFTKISGGTSTQMLTQQIQSIRADPRVLSAVMAIDSPGGSVLGTPAAAEALRQLAAEKPTVSVSEGVMASAAYWFGSAANSVYVEGVSDMVGSIGVYQRLSWEPADTNSLELASGRYKRAAMNGQAPNAEMLAYHQAQLDHLYSVFVDAVAQQRRTGTDAVLQNMADGRVFIGQQAIDAGLVDGVSTVSAMVEKLATNPGAFAARRKAVFALGAVSPMSTSAGAAPQDDPQPEKETVMPQADNTPVSRESLERDHAGLFAQVRTEFFTAGATAERERILAIQALGKHRPAHRELIASFVADGQSGYAEAAAAVIAAEDAAMSAAAQAHADDAPKPVPASNAPADKPEKTRTEMAAEATAYAAQHKCSFVEACKALGIAA